MAMDSIISFRAGLMHFDGKLLQADARKGVVQLLRVIHAAPHPLL